MFTRSLSCSGLFLEADAGCELGEGDQLMANKKIAEHRPVTWPVQVHSDHRVGVDEALKQRLEAAVDVTQCRIQWCSSIRYLLYSIQLFTLFYFVVLYSIFHYFSFSSHLIRRCCKVAAKMRALWCKVNGCENSKSSLLSLLMFFSSVLDQHTTCPGSTNVELPEKSSQSADSSVPRLVSCEYDSDTDASEARGSSSSTDEDKSDGDHDLKSPSSPGLLDPVDPLLPEDKGNPQSTGDSVTVSASVVFWH